MYKAMEGFWAMDQRAYTALAQCAEGKAGPMNAPQAAPTAKGAAVVQLVGAMMKNPDPVMSKWLGLCNTSQLGIELRAAADNPKIGKILLYVDSGGGTVDGTEALVEAVRYAKGKKEVIAYISGMCASAAYWVASQATAIYTGNKTDLVGSIGTIVGHVKLEGVTLTVIRNDSSPHKAPTSNYSPLTQDGLEETKKVLNDLADIFKSSVKKGRPKVDESAMTGRIYTASEALRLGLIDGIKSVSDALKDEPKPMTAQADTVLGATWNKEAFAMREKLEGK